LPSFASAAFSIASRALPSSSVATSSAALGSAPGVSDATKKPARSPSQGSMSFAYERPVSDSLNAFSSSPRMRSPALPSPGNFSISASMAACCSSLGSSVASP
jgi:hypothetical protein